MTTRTFDRIAGALLALLLTLPALARAQAGPVPLDRPHVEKLGEPGPHWFWANDVSFFNMADGRAHLLDADSGRLLGMLSTGIFFAKLEIPSGRAVIYSPETYYSRHTRGERTDVVTYYDANTLAVLGETVVPGHRHSGLPNIGFSALTDDERFVLVYNFSPAQSVTVVNVEAREFVEEIQTPGCALTYATGETSFMMMCGNGSLMTIALDDQGREASRERTDPFFDPQQDPVMEKGVRREDVWYFVSYGGDVYEVDVSGNAPGFREPWPLQQPGEAGWRPGGYELLGMHAGRNELAVLMHEHGKSGSHKNPGTEIWVYDLEARERVRRMPLTAPAVSIVVTRDEHPVLLASRGEPVIDVYDFTSGKLLRTIEGVGQTPLFLQVP